MPTNTLILPDMPKIAGLTFRNTAGIDDLGALLEVHAGRATRDGVDPYSSEEDYPSRERLGAALEGLNPEQRERRLVAEVNGKVIGYTTLGCWQESDGRWVYLVTGWVLPEWRGKGIGTAMLHWGEEKSRQWAAAERPGASYEFAANASSTEQDTTALLLHEGYAAGYTVLELGLNESAPVEEAPLPAGVELRPVFRIHYLPIAHCIAEAYKDEYADKRYQEIFDPVDYAQTAVRLEARPEAVAGGVGWRNGGRPGDTGDREGAGGDPGSEHPPDVPAQGAGTGAADAGGARGALEGGEGDPHQHGGGV